MIRFPARSFRHLPALAGLCAAALPTLAQGRKLNAPFPRVVAGDVVAFQFTPDGGAVYVADQDTDEVYELYAVPSSGGAAIKLSGPLVEGGDVESTLGGVHDIRVSSDGQHVVYVADQEVDEHFELYSAPIDGSHLPVKLNHALAPGTGLASSQAFQISSDGRHVVYLANDGLRRELFSVPLDGSAASVRLNETNQHYTAQVGISPDGGWVVYTTLREGASFFELYSVPIDGNAAPLRLSPSAVFDVHAFFFSPDGGRVVFSFGSFSFTSQIFSVPTDRSSAAVALNGAFVPGRYVRTYAVSPAGTHVVYAADQGTDEVYELYAVPLEGGATPVKLNGPLPADGDVLGELRFNGTGSRVTYLADQDVDEVAELYSVRVDGGAPPLVLSGALVPGGDVQSGIEVDPSGTRLLYFADAETDGLEELYSTPISGNAPPVKLSGPLATNGFVLNGFQAAGARVLYLALQAGSSAVELYSAPVNGGAAAHRVNGPLVTNGAVLPGFVPSADGMRVLYRADQESNELYELFGAATSGGNTVKLSGTVQPGPVLSDARSFALTPDGSQVLFVVDRGTPSGADPVRDAVELYRVSTRGGRAPSFLADDVRSPVKVSPDGARAVYLGSSGVYSVHVDGSEAPLRIADGTLADLFPDWRITPDGSRVVFLSFQATAYRLWSVPIDGSAQPIQLSADGRVGLSPFQFAAGGRVLYTAATQSAYELFSVPFDGSAAPVRLNPPLVLGGSLPSSGQAFEVNRDGTLVVYVADQVANDRFEIYSVPVDGSAAALKLTPNTFSFSSVVPPFRIGQGDRVVFVVASNNGRKLYSVPIDRSSAPLVLADAGPVAFEISPDGSRVVYSSWNAGGFYELAGVPSDGSAAPIQLSGTHGAGRNVQNDFRFSRDGRRVVYRADQEEDEVYNLYSVPTDGSHAPVGLSRLHGSGDALSGFQISPLGQAVVYRTNAELFAAPLDGSRAPARLNGALTNGSVKDDFVVGPGAQVLYRAEQDAPNVIELYASPLPRPLAAAPAPR